MPCKKCGIQDDWCKPCQIKDLKENFINWTSGNEEVDNFIQERQLKINDSSDKVFEWIPYNQFLDIKEIDKDDFSTISLAKWKDGSLYWSGYNKKYMKQLDEVVTLKYLHDLQNVEEFLNEV